jgi:hypothetical protein
MKPNHQPTFDDLEPVLEPEGKEKILEPWSSERKGKHDVLRFALKTFEERKAHKEVMEILTGDPLF